MTSRKNRKVSKKTKIIVIAVLFIVAATAILKPWKVFDNRSYDPDWPYHDTASGDYSGGYDGIDISIHQGKLRWKEIALNHRLKFIFVKASEGLYLKDPCYDRNVSHARSLGIKVGAYHFLTKDSGTMQFANFARHIDLDSLDLLPVLDCEDDGTLGWSRREIQTAVKAFSVACQARYGVKPIIYCSESYYKDYLSPDFDDYKLFIASYSGIPVLPGKAKYLLWQRSRHGRIPGVWTKVDLDTFAPDTSIEDLRIK